MKLVVKVNILFYVALTAEDAAERLLEITSYVARLGNGEQ